MSDDPLTKFTARHAPKPSGASARPAAPLPPSLVVNHDTGGREAYEAFDNKVATPYVEIRCHAAGIFTLIPYAQMGAIKLNVRTDGEIMFTGAGHSVEIKGRSLRDIVLALRLHTCNFIQDFSPEHHILPQPVDPRAPFVESITVEVLRPPRPGDRAKE